MKKTFIKKVEQLEKKESKIKLKDIKEIQKDLELGTTSKPPVS